jgi:hypothetical protein
MKYIWKVEYAPVRGGTARRPRPAGRIADEVRDERRNE